MNASTLTSPGTLPMRKKWPLLGSLLAIQNDRFGFLMDMAACGEVSGCHIGPVPVMTINHPAYIQSVLVEHSKQTDKGWIMHRAFPGNGVFISEGTFHDRQRKVMAPSFTPRQIASYADCMAWYGERLAETWQDGQVINLTKAMAAITTSIVGKTLFDADVFTETSELGKALMVVFNHAAHMVVSPFSLPGNWPTPRNRAKDRAWRVIRHRIQRMIDERRAHPSDRNDFLSLLMQARDDEGQPMDDVQLVDEAVTLFSGGQETVANALGWTWYVLCQHPDIYQEVQQEVDSVLQGRSPTLADLGHLPLSLQVFKETLRLYPSAPAVLRQALEDLVIESDTGGQAYLMKKGTVAIVSIYAIHRLASLYPEPERFNPTRHFTQEAEKRLPRYGFMPFGAGPRICIGNHFAMLEGQILLATLAQRVTLELLPGQSISPSSKTLTTRPDQDIYCLVHKR